MTSSLQIASQRRQGRREAGYRRVFLCAALSLPWRLFLPRHRYLLVIIESVYRCDGRIRYQFRGRTSDSIGRLVQTGRCWCSMRRRGRVALSQQRLERQRLEQDQHSLDTDNSFECTYQPVVSIARACTMVADMYLLPSLRRLLLGTSNRQFGQKYVTVSSVTQRGHLIC